MTINPPPHLHDGQRNAEERKDAGADEEGGHDKDQTVEGDRARQSGSSMFRRPAGQREENRRVADGVDDRE